jgi:hypothetical protein
MKHLLLMKLTTSFWLTSHSPSDHPLRNVIRKTGYSAPGISTLSSHCQQFVRHDEGIDTVNIFTVADVDLDFVVHQELALLLVCLVLLAHGAAHWQGALGAWEQGCFEGSQAGGANRGGDQSRPREICCV